MHDTNQDALWTKLTSQTTQLTSAEVAALPDGKNIDWSNAPLSSPEEIAALDRHLKVLWLRQHPERPPDPVKFPWPNYPEID